MPSLSSKLINLLEKTSFSSNTSKNILIMHFSKHGDTPKVSTENKDSISFPVFDSSILALEGKAVSSMYFLNNILSIYSKGCNTSYNSGSIIFLSLFGSPMKKSEWALQQNLVYFSLS